MTSAEDPTLVNGQINSQDVTITTSNDIPNERNVADSELIDVKLILHSGAKQIISLFIPVSLCMFLVAFIAKSVPYFTTTDVYLIYTPFNTPNADVATSTWETIANVAIFLGVVIFMTFLLVLLFKFKCYKCLSGWLIMTTFLIVFFISFIFFTEVLRASMIFFDTITFAILLWNFGVMGLISIHWHSPLILQQAYLIFNSIQMALLFVKYLPKWTCWVLLGALAVWDLIAVLCPRGPLRMLVEMAHARDRPLLPAMIYSTTCAYTVSSRANSGSTGLVEVANPSPTPCKASLLANLESTYIPSTASLSDSGDDPNPSNAQFDADTDQLNESSRRRWGKLRWRRRRKEVDAPPSPTTPPLSTEPGDARSCEMESNPVESERRPSGGVTGGDNPEPTARGLRLLQEAMTQREEHGVKLGLGDFIFYSLLIGRAALDGDLLTIVACYVAILVGMCVTIVALTIVQKALPALPISIACGIVFYFATSVVITPFIRATSEKRLYF